MSGIFPDTRERWRHRLPHWEVTGRPHFITIRCAGSLPADVLGRVREIHAHLAATAPASPQFAALQRQYFSTCEKYLDRSEGFAPFHTPAAAKIVLGTWRALSASTGWQPVQAVVMPNHVHFLIAAISENPTPLRTALRQWKGHVARRANLQLGRRGAFWQEDWFDRWMRNDAEEERVLDYIRQNPVKAGLVRTWSDWPWILPSPDSPG